MHQIAEDKSGVVTLLMGNEAIARGALEAGAKVCTAYPGNPSSEILGTLAKVSKEMDSHVEWSVNEKVALEVAAAASFSGLRALCAMKQNGMNVASDFLLSVNMTGILGGLVLVVTDDPGGHSSTNEEDSRYYAKLAELPLLEPGTFQEAKDVTRWAFELSETLHLPVIVRSTTRISHARGNVRFDDLSKESRHASFDTSNLRIPLPVMTKHEALLQKLQRATTLFEDSPFNSYKGPHEPELLIITSGTGWMYSAESVSNLAVEGRVGILKLGTTWPLPEKLILQRIKHASSILFIEEVAPFLEESVKAFYAKHSSELGSRTFWGKKNDPLPSTGELTPDIVKSALEKTLSIQAPVRSTAYIEKALKAAQEFLINRDLCFCAGCPHRATYWAIKRALALDGRDGVLLGDIGCYALGKDASGYKQMKTMHAMGSGAGLASGLSKLSRFGLNQPVLAVCGDSTFYHAVMPALANAHYNKANFLLLLLDNSATAMTGFQPHPGTGRTADGNPAPILAPEAICEALGARVEIGDPFDTQGTTSTILRLIGASEGVKVLILRQPCALIRSKMKKKIFTMAIEPDRCIGDACGCQRLCTRIFKCPGLVWDRATGKTMIDEAICSGCGVCADVCPEFAIVKERCAE